MALEVEEGRESLPLQGAVLIGFEVEGMHGCFDIALRLG